MNIGLDYDDTFTRDPWMWTGIIRIMRQAGHRVYIVTWRSESESTEIYSKLGDKLDGIYPTNRKAKKKFMEAQGIIIDVWIDDMPLAILQDMESYSGVLWE